MNVGLEKHRDSTAWRELRRACNVLIFKMLQHMQCFQVHYILILDYVMLLLVVSEQLII